MCEETFCVFIKARMLTFWCNWAAGMEVHAKHGWLYVGDDFCSWILIAMEFWWEILEACWRRKLSRREILLKLEKLVSLVYDIVFGAAVKLFSFNLPVSHLSLKLWSSKTEVCGLQNQDDHVSSDSAASNGCWSELDNLHLQSRIHRHIIDLCWLRFPLFDDASDHNIYIKNSNHTVSGYISINHRL